MSLGRLYTVQFNSVAVTAVQDLFELVVPSDAVMVLRSIRITQESDAGDSASEQLAFQIKRGVGSTSGSGGTVPSVNKIQTGDAAAGITAEANNTTQAIAGGGSLTTLLEECENIHAGWLHAPPPDERFIFSPSEVCIIALQTTPADSLTMSGTVVVEEIGG
jgi:hypothetical protein